MGKENLKAKKGVLTITNKLGKFERLNQEGWKFLENGAVHGLAPVEVIQKGKKLILRVEQSGWIPLMAYLQSGIDDETALSFIQNTLRIAHDCERHGLRINNLCWTYDRIFVDSQGGINMIYWPVTTLEQSDAGPLSFYYSFCNVLAGGNLGASIAAQYAQYFYQRDYFDLPLFYQMMQDILEQWRRNRNRKQREEWEKQQDEYRPDRHYITASGWLERPGKNEKIMLDREKTLIGRDPAKCHVGLPGHEGVSREHAVILEKEGQYYLTDLGSRNGTFLRGERLQPHVRVALHDGDSVRFQDVTYVFHKQEMNRTISVHQLYRR